VGKSSPGNCVYWDWRSVYWDWRSDGRFVIVVIKMEVMSPQNMKRADAYLN